MPRAKKGKDKQKVGRKPNFSCRKQAILATFGGTYKDANSASKKEVALFFDKTANWCINRWGYSTTLGVDVGDEDNDETEVYSLDDDHEPADDDISEADATLRSDYFSDLQTVSHFNFANQIHTHHDNRN